VARTVIIFLALAFAAILPSNLDAQGQGKVQPGRQSADALARDLHVRYQSIRDYSADFIQSYRAGVLKTQTQQERGSVAIKKPGKMRWIYTHPSRKELVSDGVKLYWYVPEFKEVIESNVATQSSTPYLFLSGRGDIARDFVSSYTDTPVQGTLALKLVPRKSEPEYEYLVVALDPNTLQIRGLLTKDYQGGESAFTFSNIKENRGLSDGDFVFRRPSGVKVVTDGGR
jgi:outer membrane lipoprotein carrier protein